MYITSKTFAWKGEERIRRFCENLEMYENTVKQ